MDLEAEQPTVTLDTDTDVPANEWEASGNLAMYSEMNGRFAKEWRERFVADPKVRAVIRRSFDY